MHGISRRDQKVMFDKSDCPRNKSSQDCHPDREKIALTARFFTLNRKKILSDIRGTQISTVYAKCEYMRSYQAVNKILVLTVFSTKLFSTKIPELICLGTCWMWLWKLRTVSKTIPKNLKLSVGCTSVFLRCRQNPGYQSLPRQKSMSSVFPEF